jgi:flagellar motor switch/type III secretory pathway protein FliN
MSEAVASGIGALPREGAPARGAAWVAARVLGSLPRRLDLAVGGFGPVTLTWEGYGASAALRGEAAAFALSRGRDEGRLTLDAALAARVVAVALGADAGVGASLGRLGPGARGIVAGFIASVLHAAGAPLSVALAPADRAPALDGVVVSLGVAFAGGTGWAALEAPRGWLDDAASLPADARELGALEVDAAVELGRTTLAAGELSTVSPGDAIVFDGVPALVPAAQWPARLIIGEHRAEVTVAAGGALALAGGFVRAPALDSARGGRGDTTALTTLSSEIVAELARVRLRGDELVGLQPGRPIVVEGLREGPVVVRVGGRPWAEGELTDVDGELAVRIVRLRA